MHVISYLAILQYFYVYSLPIKFSTSNVGIIYVGVLPPTNVSATVLSTDSIQITWSPSPSDNVTGYLISYTTTDPFTSNGSVTVNGDNATSGTLTNLEEGTLYTITVEAVDNKNRTSTNSSEVSETTYTASK